jgi:hypothetical protein
VDQNAGSAGCDTKLTFWARMSSIGPNEQMSIWYIYLNRNDTVH